MTNLWLRYSWLRAFGISIQFLTRLPLPKSFPQKLEDFSSEMIRAVVLFTIVGALIGASTGLVLYIGSFLFSLQVSILLALAVELRLTGALHEDAVADYCDGFGGGNTPDKILNIMKDSRLGTFGVLGLTVAFSLRAAGLMTSETPDHAILILILTGAVGRLSIILFVFITPPIPTRNNVHLINAFKIDRFDLFLSIIPIFPILAITLVASPRATIVYFIIQGVILIYFRRGVMKRLGGSTGDCAGAVGYSGIVISTLIFSPGK